MRKLIRNRKGQGLVEYALIIAGVALISIVGITMFGHKVADLIGVVAAVLPGAHTDDNGADHLRPFGGNDRRRRRRDLDRHVKRYPKLEHHRQQHAGRWRRLYARHRNHDN